MIVSTGKDEELLINPYDACYISYQVNASSYNPVMFVASRFGTYNCTITKISDTNTSKMTSGIFIKTSIDKGTIKFSFTSGGILAFIKVKNAIK